MYFKGPWTVTNADRYMRGQQLEASSWCLRKPAALILEALMFSVARHQDMGIIIFTLEVNFTLSLAASHFETPSFKI